MKPRSEIYKTLSIHSVLLLLAVAVLSGLSVGCNGGAKAEGDTSGKTAEKAAEPATAIPHYMKIKHVDVGAIDPTMVKAGKEIFEMKCTACHKLDERYVGPALGEVTKRRTPEYIMNMILDTETMIENDDTVKCLLQTFLMKMPNQSVDEKDARNVLEHLRSHAENINATKK